MRILFLCVGNSCRSQMAEGLLKDMRPDIEVMSAGSKPCCVHPTAIRAMSEIGIDISKQQSKHVDAFAGQDFDYVITLCAEAVDQICPTFPGKAHHFIHWAYPDPVYAEGQGDEALNVFREVRDQIKAGIESWLVSQT